jgi:hypothetical protein
VAAGLIGLFVAGPLAALVGALGFAVLAGFVISSKERRKRADNERQQAAGATAIGASPPETSSPARSAEESLHELNRLRDAGLISDEEFAAKRADILRRV